MDGIR